MSDMSEIVSKEKVVVYIGYDDKGFTYGRSYISAACYNMTESSDGLNRNDYYYFIHITDNNMGGYVSITKFTTHEGFREMKIDKVIDNGTER